MAVWHLYPKLAKVPRNFAKVPRGVAELRELTQLEKASTQKRNSWIELGNKQINEVFDVITKNYDPFSSDHANSGLANLATGKIAHKDTDNYLKTCIDEGRKARIAFQAGCVEYSANFLKTLKRRLVKYFYQWP